MPGEGIMVPFVAPGWRYEDAPLKTLRDVLKLRGISRIDIKTKDDAVNRLQKADTQPVIYEGLKEPELCDLIQKRGISCDDFAGTSREPSIALELADGHLTFPRFMGLPAKLRNRVYSFVFANETPFTPALVQPKNPAITKVSRQLREESLHLFYATQTFVIKSVVQHGHSLAIAKIDRMWLKAIGIHSVANIRSLAIARFDAPSKMQPGPIAGAASFHLIRLDFDITMRHARVRSVEKFWWNKKAVAGVAPADVRNHKFAEEMRERVEGVVQSTCKANGLRGGVMTSELIERIGKAVLRRKFDMEEFLSLGGT